MSKVALVANETTALIHFVTILKAHHAGFSCGQALVITLRAEGRHETGNVSPLLFGSALLFFHPFPASPTHPGSAHSGLFTLSLDNLSGPSYLQTLVSALRSLASERQTRKSPLETLVRKVLQSVSARPHRLEQLW